MPRCRCSNASSCLCSLTGSDSIAFSGAGSSADPFVGAAIIDPDAANALELRDSGLYVPRSDNTLSYVQIVASTALVSAETDVVTASPVDVANGERLEITFYWPSLTGTAANDTFDIRIKEGVTQLQRYNLTIPTGGFANGGSAIAVVTPAAGIHTYKATLVRTSGAGTAAITAAATSPAYILVKSIGE